jgi:hypothetical protein
MQLDGEAEGCQRENCHGPRVARLCHRSPDQDQLLLDLQGHHFFKNTPWEVY